MCSELPTDRASALSGYERSRHILSQLDRISLNTRDTGIRAHPSSKRVRRSGHATALFGFSGRRREEHAAVGLGREVEFGQLEVQVLAPNVSGGTATGICTGGERGVARPRSCARVFGTVGSVPLRVWVRPAREQLLRGRGHERPS